MKLFIHPVKSLNDEELSIRAEGLLPKQPVTIASYLEENKIKFRSYAYYVTDDHGVLDLQTMAAVGGCYKGVEPMGLFWSMYLLPGQRKGLRLMKKDVTSPSYVKISLFKDHINPSEKKLDYLLTEIDIERWHMADNVRRYEIAEGRLRGALFVPQGKGPFPGIVDMYGSGGRIEGRAALLASKGYVVFHLEFFGEPPLPDTFDVDLDYFDDAFDFMNAHPKVEMNNIGIIGISWGGEIALLYASVSCRIKALVAISCSRYVTVTPHSYKNETFPCIPYDYKTLKVDEHNQFIMKGTTFPRKPEARIKLENIKVPVLMLQGSDDLNIAPTAEEDVALAKNEFGATNIEVVTYQGAGHLIEPPYAPFCYVSYHKIMNTNLVWGGKQVAHSKAQEHSWKLIQNFFSQHLIKNSHL